MQRPTYYNMSNRVAYLSPSPTPRMNSEQRVAISPNTHSRLKTFASKRFRGVGSLSKLSCIVLDSYLSHLERAYFGRAKATACIPIPTNIRDFDAVLFDMDGVLCDSEIASRRAAVSVFQTYYNTIVNEEDFSPFTGTGEANFLAGVANLYNIPDFDEEKAKEQFFHVYTTYGYTADLTSFPGVRNLVERMKQLGLKVAVASSADGIKVNANLEAIGLPKEEFDYITDSTMIVNKKPSPDIFYAAAQGVGCLPERCVVIEDAVVGVKAAKLAGMRCIGVTTSLDKEKLIQAGADVIRSEPAMIEIVDIFGKDVFAEMDQIESET